MLSKIFFPICPVSRWIFFPICPVSRRKNSQFHQVLFPKMARKRAVTGLYVSLFVRPKKKKCLFPVTRPTLWCDHRLKFFYWHLRSPGYKNVWIGLKWENLLIFYTIIAFISKHNYNYAYLTPKRLCQKKILSMSSNKKKLGK